MSFLDDVLTRRMIWVTGKGGVGKSTIAAALAHIAASRGIKTLLLDVEGRGDASRFLEAPETGPDIRQVNTNLYQVTFDPETVLDEYLKVALHLPRLARLGPVRKLFDFVATAAPGVKEILVAGKVAFEERRTGADKWGLIVVDAPPSGQIVSYLTGPQTLQSMVDFGMIRNQTDWVKAAVEDPTKSGVVVVALPEEMPVTETEELLEEMKSSVGTPVVGIVANRVLARPELALSAGSQQARERFGGLAVDAAELIGALADNQRPMLERLRALGPEVMEVRTFTDAEHDGTTTRKVAQELERA